MSEPPIENRSKDNPQVGDTVFVAVLGRPAPATILAIIDERMLIEYEIGTYSALRIVPLANPASLHFRRVSYHDCPRSWLAEIVANGLDWIGAPRGCSTPAPSPSELLATWDAPGDDAPASAG